MNSTAQEFGRNEKPKTRGINKPYGAVSRARVRPSSSRPLGSTNIAEIAQKTAHPAAPATAGC